MIIDKEFENLIPQLTDYEFKNLENSIITEGCRDPLVVWGDILIDGHSRYKICLSHNIKFNIIQMDFVSREEVLLWIMRNQLSRRNLNDFQRIELVRKFEASVKAQAKKRQGTRNDLEEHSGKITGMLKEGKESRDELGAMAGVSGKTYEHGVEVLDKAPKPVIISALRRELSINAAYEVTKMRQEQQDEIAERIVQGENPKAVIADVKQRDKAEQEEAKSDLEKQKIISLNLTTDVNYILMKLHIKNLAADDCALFLWCQYHMLPYIFKSTFFEDLGFKYRTIAFILMTPDTVSELCLLATRGDLIINDILQPKIIYTSEKGFSELIKEIIGDIPVCELP